MSTPEEILNSINDHKWYISEKAGCDVGWEPAVLDWFLKYGPKYLNGGNRFCHCTSCGHLFSEGFSTDICYIGKSIPGKVHETNITSGICPYDMKIHENEYHLRLISNA